MLFQDSILTSIHIGELTTETIVGTDMSGTINGFPINDFMTTGEAGKPADLGEDRKPGGFRDISLEHKHTRRY